MGKLVMELRFDPILGEWVMVSNIREERPWRPSGYCPFCPGAEETGYGWDVLVLRNRFPMLSPNPPEVKPHWFYKKEKAIGDCLVVVETPVHDIDDLSDLSREQIVKVLYAVRDSFTRYKAMDWARYFLWFRNKGREIGVSLTHPHSQVYVLPFIPTKIMRELENARKYYYENKECLFCRILSVERKDRIRIIYENNSWTAFLPFYAHWPFEIHIYANRHVQRIDQLSNDELKDLADTLKTSLCALKNIFEKPMPYMMVMHQSPYCRGDDYEYYHLHIEIYGVFRRNGKLKCAAGVEMGGGNFTYDRIPEENAKLVRKILREKCL
jgi:UDPglucose--hexose-1-phosphate uridylyltransferase